MWLDPDGGTTTLRVLYRVKGRFAPSTRRQEEAVPGQPGLRLREVVHDAREFVLPIHVHGATDDALRTSLRDLVVAMDPVRGDGKIRVTSPVGDQREITCRAVAGLDMDETLGDTSTPTDQLASIVFRATDPYWYATSDTVVDYTLGSTATFFPIFPVRLTSSDTFADATVDNTGDVEAWPVWVLTGPAGATIAIRNLTTGKAMTMGLLALSVGEIATIDTRPGVKTMTRQDGTNLYPNLNGSLWPLVRGSNAVRVELSGATAATTVRLSYRPRWLSA